MRLTFRDGLLLCGVIAVAGLLLLRYITVHALKFPEEELEVEAVAEVPQGMAADTVQVGEKLFLLNGTEYFGMVRRVKRAPFAAEEACEMPEACSRGAVDKYAGLKLTLEVHAFRSLDNGVMTLYNPLYVNHTMRVRTEHVRLDMTITAIRGLR